MRELPNHVGIRGLTITEVMVVLVVIGILCMMALPNFTKYRESAFRDQCIVNLRRIVTAKEHWSLETGAADTATPDEEDLEPYIEPHSDLDDSIEYFYCPCDTNKSFSTSYAIKDIKTKPECKIAGETHVLE